MRPLASRFRFCRIRTKIQKAEKLADITQFVVYQSASVIHQVSHKSLIL